MAKEDANTKKKRPTAEKRMLQNEKRRLQNKQFKSSVRTAIRKLESALEKKEASASQEALNQVFSMLDLAAKRGLYKFNKVSRSKSRLAARVAKISA